MDAQDTVSQPEPAPDIVLSASRTETPAPTVLHEVSDQDFEEIVRGALEAVGGTLLFRMRTGTDSGAGHAAAAVVGLGDSRQFLLLTLPARGGQLKVETTSHSENPLAQIAESYAGLMDVLKAAA